MSSKYKGPSVTPTQKNKLDLLYTVDESGWMYVSNIWRIGISGENLVVQKYENNIWVNKGSFS